MVMDTVSVLREFNQWRRGDESTQPDPRVIGEAIDAACEEIERLRAETRDLRGRLSDSETIGSKVVRIHSDDALPWGRDDLMAIAAVRYCLGRMSYIVGDCADWLAAQWPNISEHARKVISRDIEEEFVRDDAARASGSEYLPLGMDIDRRVWEGVRRLWRDGEEKVEEV